MRLWHLVTAAIAVACFSATGASGEYPRSEANHEMNYGLDYLRDGKFDLAEPYFKMAAVVQKDKPEAAFLLGIAHLAQQEWKEAEAALLEAYALNPALKGTVERAWQDIGISAPAAERALAAMRAQRANQQDSSPSATPTQAKERSSAQPWTGLAYSSDTPEQGTAARELFDGKDYLRNNMPATAKDFLLRAVTADPQLAEGHFWLAGAYKALGDSGGAKRHLSRAYSLDPSLRAHEAELDRFESTDEAISSTAQSGAPNQCQALYATCMTSATRCTMSGCVTDYSRQAICTGELHQCKTRNRM